MPEYDPDSDLMSLYLTIPMWKSSIERLKFSVDIRHTSKNARDKLLRELGALAETAFNLSDYIMEEGNTDNGNRTESGPVCSEGPL